MSLCHARLGLFTAILGSEGTKQEDSASFFALLAEVKTALGRPRPPGQLTAHTAHEAMRISTHERLDRSVTYHQTTIADISYCGAAAGHKRSFLMIPRGTRFIIAWEFYASQDRQGWGNSAWPAA